MALLVLLIAAAGAGGSWWQSREVSISVVSHFPVLGAADVPADARVDVLFSEPIGVGDPLRFVLHDQQGREVTSAVRLNAEMRAVELEPVKPLSAGVYTAAIEVPGVLAPVVWSFEVPKERPLTQGPGGPILVVLDPANPYDDFLPEILRAEGFSSFRTVRRSQLSSIRLREHQVVLVSGHLDPEASGRLEAWVRRGGDAILFRPVGALARAAGLVLRESGPRIVREGQLVVDAGAGGATRSSVDSDPVPLRLHAPADVRGTARGVSVIGRVGPRDDVPAQTGPRADVVPAVTVRPVGDRGGSISAFTFDLARSVVLTRQGNPRWAGQERDGETPIRPDDLFFGALEGDEQPDWVDLDSVQVPHADEQMRVLGNLVVTNAASTHPLPKWWYFPQDHEAVLVLAADDHGTESGTVQQFDEMVQEDPEGCDVDAWECARATAWIYPDSGISAEQASDLEGEGFDIGAHISTNCQNWSEKSLDLAFVRGLRAFRERFPDLPAQQGSRLHCIAWSDQVTQPRVERSWGVRFDMNYYYWPGEWALGREGFMTGSGVPMRFSDLDGGLIDVYQQESHLVDQVFDDDPDAVRRLIARARGPEGYYGAFGTHFDYSNDFGAEVIGVARDLDVPMVSARQMLEWIDGRNASTVSRVRWDETTMQFTVHGDPRTGQMLRGMLPLRALGGTMVSVSRDGVRIDHVIRVVKSVPYAVFDAEPGDYRVVWNS